jgi:copper chaperone NosL
MPIWRSDLSAPQYPQGLDLTVYNDRVDGDVHEVDALNHYVGMKPYRFGDFWETELWWPTIGALIVLAVGATLVRKRWLARLARIGIWIAPLGVLADVQFRLYQFGHELKPGAALRIDEFTPKVIGGTSVLNFDVMSYPGEAMFAIWAAAALLSFGPWFVTRLVPALGRTLNALLSDETPATPRAAEATRG